MSAEDKVLCIVGFAATIAIVYLRAFTRAGVAPYVVIVALVIYTPVALRLVK